MKTLSPFASDRSQYNVEHHTNRNPESQGGVFAGHQPSTNKLSLPHVPSPDISLLHVSRVAALFFLLLTIGIGQAWADDIDWSQENYVLCDAGGDSYANKYKVSKDAGQNVASIQNFQSQGWGIYTSFGTGITGVTGVSSYKVEGAGVCLHCSSFTKQETEVTVTCSGGTYTFTVYYENGNIAQGKPSFVNAPDVNSSDIQNVSNGNDGDTNTQTNINNCAATVTAGTAYFQIDLGRMYNITRIDLYVEGSAYASSGTYEISTDGTNWATIGQYTISNVSSNENASTAHSTTVSGIGRYIRYIPTALRNGTSSLTGGSAWRWRDLMVYGTPAVCTNDIYFVNFQMWDTPKAHMWKADDTNNATTWPGTAMTQVSATTDPNGFTVWKASVENNRDRVIFSNNGGNQLADATISTCHYYFNGTWYEDLEDIPSAMMYFVNTPDWATPYAHLWNGSGKGQNTTWPGVAMTNTGLTNSDGNALWGFAKGDHSHVIFNQGNSTDQTDKDYLDIGNDVIFNYADDAWYRPHNIYLCGTMFGTGEWSAQLTDAHKFPDWDKHSTVVTKDFVLDAETTYDFKIVTDWRGNGSATGFWRGNGSATITSDNTTIKLSGENESGNNAQITTTIAGTYTFTYDVTNAKLTVTYPVEETVCAGVSDETEEGTFEYGYNFSTLANGDVQIQFEWLGDGEPANIYFHDYTSGGLVESGMTRSGKVGTKTITGKSAGDIIVFGCKFDKNGVYRTRRFVYKVGYECGVPECSETGNIAAGKLTKAGFSRMYTSGKGGRNVNEQPQFAVDGNTSSRFIAWGADNAAQDAYRWWAVDLGAEYNLSNIKIYWQEAGRASADYVLQTRSDLSADFENDAPYSNTGWTTIKTVTETQAIGSANSYDVSGYQGRYIRLVANDRINIAISEFEVYVSGCVTDDPNPPVMGTAAYYSNNAGNTGAIITLTATDTEGDVTRYRLNPADGGSPIYVTTDAQNQVTLDGLTSGSYSYNVYAVDAGGNVSDNYAVLTFCFLNSTENLALNKTARSGWSRTETCFYPNGTACRNDAEAPDKAVDGAKGSGATARPDGTFSEHRQFGIGDNFPTRAWWAVDLGTKYQLKDIDIYWTADEGSGIVPRSYLIQVSTETPTDFTNDVALQNLQWETVRTITNADQHHGMGTSNRNIYSFTTADNVVARYIRIVNQDESNKTMYLAEVEVYAQDATTAIKCDDTAPTMVSATYESYNAGNTGVVVTLHGNDNASDDAINHFKLVKMNGETAVEAIYVHTNATTHKAEIAPLEKGNYTYRVYAIDEDGNVSNNYVTLTFCFTPPTYNLVTGATASAGATDGSDVPANAIDGNTNTHWGAALIGTDPSREKPALANDWVQVDLGAKYQLHSMQIAWIENSRPTGYELQMSLDGTNFTTIAAYHNAPTHYVDASEGDYETYDFTTNGIINARYIRIQATAYSLVNGGAYGMEVADWKIFGDCYDPQTKPVMLFAETQNVRAVTTTLRATAYCEGKTFSQIYYYVELRDVTESTSTTVSVPLGTGLVDGVFTLAGLTVGHSYEAKIYACVTNAGAEVRSDNYVIVHFFTTNKSDLHFLSAENFDGAGVWEAAIGNDAHRFSYTDNAGIYYFEHTLNDAAYQYKLWDDYSKQWSEGVADGGTNLIFCGHNGEKVTMYAKGQDQYVSNFDDLYVAGEVVGDTRPWPVPADNSTKQMTYSDGIFSWTGDVTPNTNFKIVAKNKWDGCGGNNIVNWNRIMRLGDTGVNESAEATYDHEWTRATLYFDPVTWTWWWENAMTGCQREGSAGAKNPDADTGTAFTNGYKLEVYATTDNYFVVEAEPLDAGITNAILQIVGSTGNVAEETAGGVSKTYSVGGVTHTYYRFRVPMNDTRLTTNAVNNIIRFRIKFEGAAGVIKTTPYHYYDISAKNCESDTWVIYHHGQAPDGGRETFAGGRVVQPIEYRRKFDLDTWYSLYLPFDVTAVQVISGGVYYDLLPYYRRNDGTLKGKQYIIRKATPVSNMPIADFENRYPSESSNGWFDPSEEEYSTFLPQKNTPYIIQFHNAYYQDKWIVFRGQGYADIATTLSSNAAPTTDEVVNIYGNNTMVNQTIAGQSYQINYEEYEGNAWTRYNNITLYPFECYVLANEPTTQRYRIIRRGAGDDSQSGITTGQEQLADDAICEILRVYTANGMILREFRNTTPADVALELNNMVPNGLYIVVGDNNVWKIMIGGR